MSEILGKSRCWAFRDRENTERTPNISFRGLCARMKFCTDYLGITAQRSTAMPEIFVGSSGCASGYAGRVGRSAKGRLNRSEGCEENSGRARPWGARPLGVEACPNRTPRTLTRSTPCKFPDDFVPEARDAVRRRTLPAQVVQRFRLVLLLHQQSELTNEAAAQVVGLSPRQIQRWRRRWAAGDFASEDLPDRRREPAFSPARSRARPGDGPGHGV
ncbi:helix-turn-helix domain-containing protein [Fimbriiglobus ruber]|uniref:helix-turn-helix domain-containing protein n=1 Tax=Fimbriiglobus ruber TaxID=1908690 RepID=UPI003B8498BB